MYLKKVKKSFYQKTAALFCALAILLVPGAFALPESLVPGGHTAGVQLHCDGVMVIGLSSVETEQGRRSPAEDAGICRGDVIHSVNGQKVSTVDGLTEAIQDGASASVILSRGGQQMTLTVQPVLSEGSYRLGLLARDSIAGIGTITFYDPETGTFGALGHGINDSDTLQLIPLGEGTLLYSTVGGVRKGAAGNPGELQGSFPSGNAIGSLSENDDTGIYGTLTDPSLLQGHNVIPVADPDEIQEGPATILSNVNGDAIEEFSIEILRIYPEDVGEERNMMIKVTDPELLSKTGGIVQGMSGSPILQNGKLIGAVTHVLVGDPTRGYGIFIKNMLEAAEQAA